MPRVVRERTTGRSALWYVLVSQMVSVSLGTLAVIWPSSGVSKAAASVAVIISHAPMALAVAWIARPRRIAVSADAGNGTRTDGVLFTAHSTALAVLFGLTLAVSVTYHAALVAGGDSAEVLGHLDVAIACYTALVALYIIGPGTHPGRLDGAEHIAGFPFKVAVGLVSAAAVALYTVAFVSLFQQGWGAAEYASIATLALPWVAVTVAAAATRVPVISHFIEASDTLRPAIVAARHHPAVALLALVAFTLFTALLLLRPTEGVLVLNASVGVASVFLFMGILAADAEVKSPVGTGPTHRALVSLVPTRAVAFTFQALTTARLRVPQTPWIPWREADRLGGSDDSPHGRNACTDASHGDDYDVGRERAGNLEELNTESSDRRDRAAPRPPFDEAPGVSQAGARSDRVSAPTRLSTQETVEQDDTDGPVDNPAVPVEREVPPRADADTYVPRMPDTTDGNSVVSNNVQPVDDIGYGDQESTVTGSASSKKTRAGRTGTGDVVSMIASEPSGLCTRSPVTLEGELSLRFDPTARPSFATVGRYNSRGLIQSSAVFLLSIAAYLVARGYETGGVTYTAIHSLWHSLFGLAALLATTSVLPPVQGGTHERMRVARERLTGVMECTETVTRPVASAPRTCEDDSQWVSMQMTTGTDTGEGDDMTEDGISPLCAV